MIFYDLNFFFVYEHVLLSNDVHTGHENCQLQRGATIQIPRSVGNMRETKVLEEGN